MVICILYVENRHVDNVDNLFLSMRERPARIIVNENNEEMVGLLQSIEREDGSGQSFNVTVLIGDVYHVYHVREPEFQRKRKKGFLNCDYSYGKK